MKDFKKLVMVATMAMAAAAMAQEAPVTAEQEYEGVDRGNWRLTVGGFARGSMRMKSEGNTGFTGKRIEGYGAETDLMFKPYEEGRFRLWTGLGLGWMPNREVYSARVETPTLVPGVTAFYGEKISLQYGEMRLLVVPEYALTDDLALGLRLGAALDWVRARNKICYGLAGGFAPSSDSMIERYNTFTAQGIVGIQATYMITGNLGVYLGVDGRVGPEKTFKTRGMHAAKLDMTGWQAQAGLTLGF